MDSETSRRVRAARAYAGLAQKDLAAVIGRSHVYMGEIENGEREPRDGEVYEIAQACELPIEFFSAPWSRLGEATKYEWAIEYVQARERGQREGGGAFPVEPPLEVSDQSSQSSEPSNRATGQKRQVGGHGA